MGEQIEKGVGVYFTKNVPHDTYDTVNPKKLNLNGKYVFITGASKGIGRALALSYAQAGVSGIGAGARSVSALESLEKEIYTAAQGAGHPKPLVKIYEMDVTNFDAVQRAAQDLDSGFPQLDILVNNAGYLEVWKPIAESDPSEWWKTYTVNVLGPYYVSRAMLPIMLKGGMKQVVNIGSVGGLRLAPGASAYQASKFVLTRFSEFINVDHGEQGMMAFTVHPGGIMTELAGKMPKKWHHGMIFSACPD